jgi:hypothetical protein
MSKNNRILIGKPIEIGISDIDVYHTDIKKQDALKLQNSTKVRLRIGVFFDGTGNNYFNSNAVYYRQTRPTETKKNIVQELMTHLHLNYTTQTTILLIVIALLSITACKEITPSLGHDDDEYRWYPDISAPKYYPVSDARVDFGITGAGRSTYFDHSWGNNYGLYVVGERFKKIPKTVHVSYESAVESKFFEGTIDLPYDRLKELFETYASDREYESGSLMVGMAPGGWVRVWARFSTKHDITDNIKLINFQIPENPTKKPDNGIRGNTAERWKSYNTYWDHAGIPYEVWADNEKEYDLFLDFDKPNQDYNVTDVLFSSLDGTVYHYLKNNTLLINKKLPSDLVIAWGKKNDTVYYQSHILMPQKFGQTIKNVNLNSVVLELQIESNGRYGLIYLRTPSKKMKILRFKNSMTSIDAGLGKCGFSEEIEYFIN